MSGRGGGRFRRVEKRQGNYAKNKNDRSDWDNIKASLLAKEKENSVVRSQEDDLDAKFGFERFTGPGSKTAVNAEDGTEMTAIDYYFVDYDGSTFKSSFLFDPYFLVYIKCPEEVVSSTNQEMESYLMRRFEGMIKSVEIVEKEDLDMLNHLARPKKKFMKINFYTIEGQIQVRKVLQPIVSKNVEEQEALDAYFETSDPTDEGLGRNNYGSNIFSCLTEIREYDVVYNQRVAIDTGFRVGKWYTVHSVTGSSGCMLQPRDDLQQRPLMRTMAFDIETTKLPLKFPNAEIDQVMMISYMLDNEGYLIVNREIVSEDIDDFEYTPKPEYPGSFEVFNESNEKQLLLRFIEHVKETKPLIFVTYNGDFFDWPFVETRCTHHGIDMMKEIGIWVDRSGEYMGRWSVHLDAFAWVRRDSYLPQGSQPLIMAFQCDGRAKAGCAGISFFFLMAVILVLAGVVESSNCSLNYVPGATGRQEVEDCQNYAASVQTAGWVFFSIGMIASSFACFWVFVRGRREVSKQKNSGSNV